MRAMQPVMNEFFSRDTFALCDLCFVMRKNVINAAAMNVDLIAQERRCHRAAFNMPTRSARSPWRIPFHIAVFFIPSLPKGEIADVFFVVFVMFHASC